MKALVKNAYFQGILLAFLLTLGWVLNTNTDIFTKFGVFLIFYGAPITFATTLGAVFNLQQRQNPHRNHYQLIMRTFWVLGLGGIIGVEYLREVGQFSLQTGVELSTTGLLLFSVASGVGGLSAVLASSVLTPWGEKLEGG